MFLCLVQGRKRSGTDTSGGVWLSTSSSKLNQMYGVEAWASWVRMKTGQSEQEQQSRKFTHMGQNMEFVTSPSASWLMQCVSLVKVTVTVCVWHFADPPCVFATFSSPTVFYPEGPMTMKEDVLQCTSADLSYGLCRFINEVRRPNGEPYEPDSIYYLCLGIQQVWP